MKISRHEMLAALDAAKPALASKSLIDELTHFWFMKGSLLTFNDILGMDVPFEAPIEGGIKGALLLGLLSNSKAKEVTITELENEEVEFKAGAAKLRLALLSLDRAVWKFPKINSKQLLPISDKFVKAISAQLISTSADTSVPDQLGVTLVPEDDIINLYSTDSKTLTWGIAHKMKGIVKKRCVLPAPFCEQLSSVCGKGGFMLVRDEDVIAENEAGVRLYSRLVEVPSPLDFDKVLERCLPKNFDKKATPVPSLLRLALERVLVVVNQGAGDPIQITLDAEALRLYAKVGSAEIDDKVRLEHPHDEVTVWVDPVKLKRGIEDAKSIFVSKEAVVLIGNSGNIHCIATMSGNK